jgi:hypothetical protein
MNVPAASLKETSTKSSNYIVLAFSEPNVIVSFKKNLKEY